MDNKKPFIIKEESISLGERLISAFTQFFYMLFLVPTYLIAAPIVFFRVLFTSKRKVAILSLPKQDSVEAEYHEPWKKEHDNLYGSEEDKNEFY